MEDLGERRLHPFALTRGEDDDGAGLGHKKLPSARRSISGPMLAMSARAVARPGQTGPDMPRRRPRGRPSRFRKTDSSAARTRTWNDRTKTYCVANYTTADRFGAYPRLASGASRGVRS